MIGQISIKTKLGWINTYEEKGKITRVNLENIKKTYLLKIKKNLNLI